MMAELGQRYSFANTAFVNDFKMDVDADPFGLLPKSNVLKYTLDDGSWIAVRPSGTERRSRSITAWSERIGMLPKQS
jgi:phosphomannomutase